MGKITDDYLVFRILNVLQSEVSSQCVFNVSYNLSSNILNVEGIWKGMLTFFFSEAAKNISSFSKIK